MKTLVIFSISIIAVCSLSAEESTKTEILQKGDGIKTPTIMISKWNGGETTALIWNNYTEEIKRNSHQLFIGRRTISKNTDSCVICFYDPSNTFIRCQVVTYMKDKSKFINTYKQFDKNDKLEATLYYGINKNGENVILRAADANGSPLEVEPCSKCK